MKQNYIIAIFLMLHTLGNLGQIYCALTMEELKKIGETMRIACRAKQPITDEQMAMIQNGNFPDDKTAKCFLLCVMEKSQLVKRGKTQFTSAINQVDILMPDDLKEPFKQALIACEHSADNVEDLCEMAYLGAKCLKENSPKFFFP